MKVKTHLSKDCTICAGTLPHQLCSGEAHISRRLRHKKRKTKKKRNGKKKKQKEGGRRTRIREKRPRKGKIAAIEKQG